MEQGQPQSEPLEVGLPTKFDNIEPLSPGQNAEVFKAFDRYLGRPVFLKRYPIVPGELAAALREPQIAKDFAHECLASIYTAHDQSNGTKILLEMEFLKDGSLQDLLDNSLSSGKWPSAYRVLDFVTDAARGLAHLHAKGYIHRDIKPANLMLRRLNQRLRLVISDFGLARKMGDDGRAEASRHARLYRPPETLRGLGYSTSSDIYQLGMVCAQLFGCPVDYSLGSKSDADLLEAAESHKIVDIAKIQAHVCIQVRKVIKDCLAPEGVRIATSGDLVTRIQNARQHQLDWRLSTEAVGVLFDRRVPTGRSRVTVVTVGDKHIVRRENQRVGKSWRRQGPEVSFSHADLTNCRKLQQMLS